MSGGYEKSATCTVIVGRNPAGSIADDTDYIRCGQPAVAVAVGFSMCDEHARLFRSNSEPSS
jgi:hypothetical protein